MPFIIILGIISFSLAAVSETLSIMGLADTFTSIYWSMIIMGIVLGAGKLTAITFLYRHWHEISKLLSIPLLFCTLILVFVTISGHFGFLSKGYLVDSIELKKVESKIESYEEEKSRAIARKDAIDIQISQLPSDKVNSRIKLIEQFKIEQKTVTLKVNVLNDKISELKIEQIESTSHVGTIAYIAKAFGLSLDEGVKWFILMIVAAFEPLALGLTIAISALLKLRQVERVAIALSPVTVPVDTKIKQKRIPVPKKSNKDMLEPVVQPTEPGATLDHVQPIYHDASVRIPFIGG